MERHLQLSNIWYGRKSSTYQYTNKCVGECGGGGGAGDQSLNMNGSYIQQVSNFSIAYPNILFL